jgi:hypothetical protein
MQYALIILLSGTFLFAQVSPDDFFGKLTPGIAGNLSAAHFLTPNSLGGPGRFQISLGVNDVVFKYPTYDAWSYLPVPIAVAQLGVHPGLTRGQIITGVLALDLLLRGGLYPKQARIGETRPFFGGGLKVGLLRNTLVTPAVALTLAYTQINDLVIGDQDPNFEARYRRLGVVDANLSLGKHIYGIFPYLALGYKHQMIRAEYLQRAAPDPEPVPYDADIGAFAGLVGCQWRLLTLKLYTELVCSRTNPGLALGFGSGL